MPALDEGAQIAATLAPLVALRGDQCELIVVDGGSRDDTLEIARPLVDHALRAPRGRALQMNAGAAAAAGEVILFLHADTRLPDGALESLRAALSGGPHVWGRFDVTLCGRHPLLAVISRMMNLRSRLTGVATGDQAIFVARHAFEAVGGFTRIPLMEDVAISKALRRLSPPACLRLKVRTSARRWESRGVWRTMVLMWRLRLAYFLGASPESLARRYR